MQKIKSKIFYLFIIAIFTIGNLPLIQAQAQDTVEFSQQQVENRFPEELVFHVQVSSHVGQIVSAKFVFTTESHYSSSSYSKNSVDMQLGANLSLEYVLDTRDMTTPPMMPITYYWDVVDAQGNHYQSEQVTFLYEDIRYNWQVLQNSQVGVWWHNRPDSFGKAIFDIANKAIGLQHELYQANLDYQIKIVIYNSFDEFAAWHALAHDWVGGESFPNYGITAQIVENSTFQNSWLNDVIPHEISHLYFAQVTYNPTVSIPVWLNEGLAQFNEFGNNNMALGQVRTAARNGDLIPLSSLADGFGAFNEDRVRLAYDEAVSAVTYMVDIYGHEGLSTLLKEYKDGKTTDNAFQAAFGVGMGQFEADWAAWTGVSGEYVTPTAWALPTFRPSPTMRAMAANPSTPAATEPAKPSANIATPTPVASTPANRSPQLPCLSFAPIFGLGLVSLLRIRSHKTD